MTVYDFCKFFEFTCIKEKNGYIATDDMGVFREREFQKPEDAADMFDTLLYDYIDEYLEELGFEYSNSDRTFYQAALDEVDNLGLKGTEYEEILMCLVHPECITEK